MSYYKTNKGILLEETDDWQENPRTYDESGTTFVMFLRGSSSPDKTDCTSAAEFIREMFPKGWTKIDDAYKEARWGDGNKLLQTMCENKGIIILPVWRYQHSGTSYKTGAENPFFDGDWDSCMAGYIYCDRKKAAELLGLKKGSRGQKEKIIKMMEDEVRIWTAWSNGEVYGYALLSDDGKTVLEPVQDDPEVTQMIWGFYGDVEENGIMRELALTSCEYIGEEI